MFWNSSQTEINEEQVRMHTTHHHVHLYWSMLEECHTGEKDNNLIVGQIVDCQAASQHLIKVVAWGIRT